ncbi:hypothetical protein AAVH_13894 [Aphelenchoides avenae]|nr:hypothetical protein AAVH_13894 [Aphelenchus avenae]
MTDSCFVSQQLSAAIFILLVPLSTAIFNFALLPDCYDLSATMHNPVATSTQATDAQNCIDLVYSEEPNAIAISFNNETLECKYSVSMIGNYLRDVGAQPKFYLRIDNLTKSGAATSCFTNQDAEYLIMMHSYGTQQCLDVGVYDSASGFCTTTDFTYPFGEYAAGFAADKTQLLTTRAMAVEGVSYQCDDAQDPKMTFNGTWWCYSMLDIASGTASSALITGNYCQQQLGAGSNPIKVSEPREYGYDYYVYSDKVRVYLGLVLQSGTTYAWYDGTPANDLPWAPGRPVGGANDMVYVDGNYQVQDADSSQMQLMLCKKAANYQAYDPTLKFTA